MKNNLPLIIAAFVIVIGAAVWFSQKPPSEVAPPVTAPVVATTTVSEKPTAPSGGSAAPATPAAPTTPGINVGTATIWKTYRNADWGITFDYQPVWQVEAVKSKDGARVDQIILSAKEGNIYVSRKIPIAEPAQLKYLTSTKVIAGQQVKVHDYTKPNEIYAYYLNFVIPVDGIDYYVSISSFEASRKFADSFIEGIELKQ